MREYERLGEIIICCVLILLSITSSQPWQLIYAVPVVLYSGARLFQWARTTDVSVKTFGRLVPEKRADRLLEAPDPSRFWWNI